MALNGISTLATKQAKQEAKLALAETKRQNIAPYGFRTLHTLVIALLPAPYIVDTPNTSNPHVGGLASGRPWTI